MKGGRWKATDRSREGKGRRGQFDLLAYCNTDGKRRVRMSEDSSSSFVANVPFEFVGKVAGACAVAEASNIKCSSTAPRHTVSLGVPGVS